MRDKEAQIRKKNCKRPAEFRNITRQPRSSFGNSFHNDKEMRPVWKFLCCTDRNKDCDNGIICSSPPLLWYCLHVIRYELTPREASLSWWPGTFSGPRESWLQKLLSFLWELTLSERLPILTCTQSLLHAVFPILLAVFPKLGPCIHSFLATIVIFGQFIQGSTNPISAYRLTFAKVEHFVVLLLSLFLCSLSFSNPMLYF